MLNLTEKKLEDQKDDTKVSNNIASDNKEEHSPDEFYSTHKWEMVRDMDDGDWEF